MPPADRAFNDLRQEIVELPTPVGALPDLFAALIDADAGSGSRIPAAFGEVSRALIAAVRGRERLHASSTGVLAEELASLLAYQPRLD